MSELETAVCMIIRVFQKFACKEGNKNTLSKAEAKSLLEAELPDILKGAKGKGECDKLLKDLDENGDSQIDFQEFIVFVAALACAGHKAFSECKK
ncbi:protein S100-P [Gastrophryne carolinensis]